MFISGVNVIHLSDDTIGTDGDIDGRCVFVCVCVCVCVAGVEQAQVLTGCCSHNKVLTKKRINGDVSVGVKGQHDSFSNMTCVCTRVCMCICE